MNSCEYFLAGTATSLRVNHGNRNCPKLLGHRKATPVTARAPKVDNVDSDWWKGKEPAPASLPNYVMDVWDDKTDPDNPQYLGRAVWNAAGTAAEFRYAVEELAGPVLPDVSKQHTNTAWLTDMEWCDPADPGCEPPVKCDAEVEECDPPPPPWCDPEEEECDPLPQCDEEHPYWPLCDTGTVIITGKKPTIVPDLKGSYDVAYTWEITKTVEEDDVMPVAPGADYDSFNYEIVVKTLTKTVSNVSISGTVDVTNPNQFPIPLASADVTAAAGSGVTVTPPTADSAGIVKDDDGTLMIRGGQTVSFGVAWTPDAQSGDWQSEPTDTIELTLTLLGTVSTESFTMDKTMRTATDQEVDVTDTFDEFCLDAGITCNAEGKVGLNAETLGEGGSESFTYSAKRGGTTTAGGGSYKVGDPLAVCEPIGDGLYSHESSTTFTNTAELWSGSTRIGDESVDVDVCTGADLTVVQDPATTAWVYPWRLDKYIWDGLHNDGAGRWYVEATQSARPGDHAADFEYLVIATPDEAEGPEITLLGSITVTNPNDVDYPLAGATLTPAAPVGPCEFLADPLPSTVPAGDWGVDDDGNEVFVPGTLTLNYKCAIDDTALDLTDIELNLISTPEAKVFWDAIADFAAAGSATAAAEDVTWDVESPTRVVDVYDDLALDGEPAVLGQATWNHAGNPTYFVAADKASTIANGLVLTDMDADGNDVITTIDSVEGWTDGGTYPVLTHAGPALGVVGSIDGDDWQVCTEGHVNTAWIQPAGSDAVIAEDSATAYVIVYDVALRTWVGSVDRGADTIYTLDDLGLTGDEVDEKGPNVPTRVPASVPLASGDVLTKPVVVFNQGNFQRLRVTEITYYLGATGGALSLNPDDTGSGFFAGDVELQWTACGENLCLTWPEGDGLVLDPIMADDSSRIVDFEWGDEPNFVEGYISLVVDGTVVAPAAGDSTVVIDSFAEVTRFEGLLTGPCDNVRAAVEGRSKSSAADADESFLARMARSVGSALSGLADAIGLRSDEPAYPSQWMEIDGVIDIDSQLSQGLYADGTLDHVEDYWVDNEIWHAPDVPAGGALGQKTGVSDYDHHDGEQLTVAVDPLSPEITLAGAYEVDYEWTIVKDVIECAFDGDEEYCYEVYEDTVTPVKPGDDETFTYRVTVTVERKVSELKLVGSTVVVTNPNGFAVPLDIDWTGTTAGVVGTPTGDVYTDNGTDYIAANGTVTYPVTWTKSAGTEWPTSADTVTVTATPAGGDAVTESLDFSADVTPTITNATATVTDTFAEFARDFGIVTLDAERDVLDGAASGSVEYVYTADRGSTVEGSDQAEEHEDIAYCEVGEDGESLSTESTTSWTNWATVTSDTHEDDDDARVLLCTGQDLVAEIDVTATLDRAIGWDLTKDLAEGEVASKPADENGQATFDYVVTATPTALVEFDWSITGTVDVTNPNPWDVPVTHMEVFAVLDPGIGVCTVDPSDPDDAGEPTGTYVIEAGQTRSIGYGCDVTVPDTPVGSVMVQIRWDDDAALSAGSSDNDTAAIEWQGPAVSSLPNYRVDVWDDQTVPANPVWLGRATWNENLAPITFEYSLTLAGPELPSLLVEYPNIAWIGPRADEPEEPEVPFCVDGPDGEDCVPPTPAIDPETGEPIKDIEDDELVEITALPLVSVVNLEGDYLIDYPWEIVKTAEDDFSSVTAGADAEFDYTLTVTVPRRDVTGITASGIVVVTNPNAFAVPLRAVTVTASEDVTITPPTAGAIPGKGFVTYAVSWTGEDGSERPEDVIDVTVTMFGQSQTTSLDFVDVDPTITNATAAVTDTFAEFADEYGLDVELDAETVLETPAVFTYTAARGSTTENSDDTERANVETCMADGDGGWVETVRTTYTNVATVDPSDDDASDAEATVGVCTEPVHDLALRIWTEEVYRWLQGADGTWAWTSIYDLHAPDHETGPAHAIPYATYDDPTVELQVGDVLVYAMHIFNQGTEATRAAEIVFWGAPGFVSAPTTITAFTDQEHNAGWYEDLRDGHLTYDVARDPDRASMALLPGESMELHLTRMVTQQAVEAARANGGVVNAFAEISRVEGLVRVDEDAMDAQEMLAAFKAADAGGSNGAGGRTAGSSARLMAALATRLRVEAFDAPLGWAWQEVDDVDSAPDRINGAIDERTGAITNALYWDNEIHGSAEAYNPLVHRQGVNQANDEDDHDGLTLRFATSRGSERLPITGPVVTQPVTRPAVLRFLPTTGASTAILALIAAAFIGLGAALVRRRKE